MSATKPGRGLASPDSRRRPGAKRSNPERTPLVESDPGFGACVAGGRDSSSPRPATSQHARTRTRSQRASRDAGGSPSSALSGPAPPDSARCGR